MQPIVNLPSLYVSGLNISWASNTTLTVAAGQCRNSLNNFDMTVASPLTINGAVNGANGLDTGTLGASTIYSVFIISQETGYSTPSALISLSSTAPVLPTGYDTFRRIGYAITDGSTHFLLMYQFGSGGFRKYFYDAAQSVLSGGTSATYAAVSLSAFVPPVSTNVMFNGSFTPNAADDSAVIRPSGSASTTACIIYGNVAAKKMPLYVTVPCLVVSAAAKVDYVVTASGSLSLSVSGFEDHL